MPDILCDCVQCFKKEDHLRLLALRTVNGHIFQHGQPSEEQLKAHAQELAVPGARNEQKKFRVAAREEASASAQNEERVRRRKPHSTPGRGSDACAGVMQETLADSVIAEEDDSVGDGMSEGLLRVAGVMGGPGLRGQTGQGELKCLSGLHMVKIHSMTTTSVAGDYHDHKIVNITNVIEAPEKQVDKVTSAVREAILEWLGGPNYREVYEVAISQRMEDTGIWFLELEEFRQFVEGEGVVMWAMGIPGAGKTILGAIVIEHLEERFHGQDVAVGFAFLRYTVPHTSLEVLSALLSQFAEAHDDACSVIRPAYERIKAKRGAKLKESDAAAILREIASSISNVYVILDGLDEASDALKDRLLPVLVSSGVNLLILSRPLELFTHHTPDAIRLSIQARTEDIALYVRNQVEQSSRLQSILQAKPELVKQLCDWVKEKSDGMFLVAKLQMESIVRKSKSVNGLFEALDNLPSSVNEIYRHTLDRINAQPEEDAAIAHQVFLWLLHARPFLWNAVSIHGSGPYQYPTAEDIQYAVTIDPQCPAFNEGDVIPLALLLSMCGGLVTVEEEVRNGDIRFKQLRFIRKLT